MGASREGLAASPRDFFRTHESATRALLEVEEIHGIVWEPACGSGDISRVLEKHQTITKVISSDIADHGYGETGWDFLTTPLPRDADHIITNPPFERMDAFVMHALDRNPRGKIALFGRLAWLEGMKRRICIFDEHPPARVWVFSKRPMLARSDGPFVTGLIAFAWFVWYRDIVPTKLGWL